MIWKKKFVTTFVLFTLTSLGLAFANTGTRLTFEMHTSRAGEPMKMTTKYFYMGSKMRIEHQMGDTGAGDNVIIKKGKKDPLMMLIPATKTYMPLPDAGSQQLTQMSKDAAKPFKKTGKTKKIAGRKCSVVQRSLEDRKEIACIDTGLKSLFETMKSGIAQSQKDAASMWPKGMNGFPVEYKIIPKKDKGQEMRVVLTDFYKGKLNASLFEIPKEYTKKEFPKMDPEMLKKMQEMQKQKMNQ